MTKFEDHILATGMAKKVPLEEISARLGVPEDVLSRRLTHPDYLDTFNKLMQIGAASSYCKAHVLKNAPALIAKMVDIALNDAHSEQVSMLKHLSPHLITTDNERAAARVADASAEAQSKLAHVLSSLADRMELADSFRPKTINSPILEGEAALPSALARQRLERGERDGS